MLGGPATSPLGSPPIIPGNRSGKQTQIEITQKAHLAQLSTPASQPEKTLTAALKHIIARISEFSPPISTEDTTLKQTAQTLLTIVEKKLPTDHYAHLTKTLNTENSLTYFTENKEKNTCYVTVCNLTASSRSNKQESPPTNDLNTKLDELSPTTTKTPRPPTPEPPPPPIHTPKQPDPLNGDDYLRWMKMHTNNAQTYLTDIKYLTPIQQQLCDITTDYLSNPTTSPTNIPAEKKNQLKEEIRLSKPFITEEQKITQEDIEALGEKRCLVPITYQGHIFYGMITSPTSIVLINRGAREGSVGKFEEFTFPDTQTLVLAITKDPTYETSEELYGTFRQHANTNTVWAVEHNEQKIGNCPTSSLTLVMNTLLYVNDPKKIPVEKENPVKPDTTTFKPVSDYKTEHGQQKQLRTHISETIIKKCPEADKTKVKAIYQAYKKGKAQQQSLRSLSLGKGINKQSLINWIEENIESTILTFQTVYLLSTYHIEQLSMKPEIQPKLTTLSTYFKALRNDNDLTEEIVAKHEQIKIHFPQLANDFDDFLYSEVISQISKKNRTKKNVPRELAILNAIGIDKLSLLDLQISDEQNPPRKIQLILELLKLNTNPNHMQHQKRTVGLQSSLLQQVNTLIWTIEGKRKPELSTKDIQQARYYLNQFELPTQSTQSNTKWDSNYLKNYNSNIKAILNTRLVIATWLNENKYTEDAKKELHYITELHEYLKAQDITLEENYIKRITALKTTLHG